MVKADNKGVEVRASCCQCFARGTVPEAAQEGLTWANGICWDLFRQGEWWKVRGAVEEQTLGWSVRCCTEPQEPPVPAEWCPGMNKRQAVTA